MRINNIKNENTVMSYNNQQKMPSIIFLLR